MIAQVGLGPGMRWLEIGSGGYNAAAAEQDLVGQVGAWFGLGEGIAVSRVAEG